MLAVSLLADLNSAPTSSNPDEFAEFNDDVYFSAADAKHGDELWRVDSSGTNVRLFHDVVPGPTGSQISNLTPTGSYLFFTTELPHEEYTVLHATDGVRTHELTRFRYQDLRIDYEDQRVPIVHEFTVIRDQLYFMTSHGEAENLWTSDGTPGGTHPVASLPGIGSTLSTSQGQLYIRVYETYEDAKLYLSDGTNEGTYPFIEHLGGSSREGSDFVVRDDTVFFQIVEDDEQTTLFRADSKPNQQLADITQLFQVSIGDDDGFQHLTRVGNEVYFASDDRDVLWKTEGSPDDIVRVGIVDRQDTYGEIEKIIDFNGLPILVVRHGLYGTELWSATGAPDSLNPLKHINPGEASAEVDHLVQLGAELYFSAEDGVHGRELWATDGTDAGTRLVRDILESGGSLDETAEFWLATSDRLFFSANDGTAGNELWMSDGTADGTRMVSDLDAGETRGAYPHAFTVVNDELIFVADNGVSGSELWATDGSVNGTRLIHDGAPGNDSTFVYHQAQVRQVEDLAFDVYPQAISFLANRSPFLQVGGDTYFLTGQDTDALWKLAPGMTEPELIAELRPGAVASLDINGAALNDRFVFTLYRRGGGFELWGSDGTEAGTTRLRSFANSFEEFVVLGDKAYFSGDSRSGEELWSTDGTKDGTQPVADAVPGRNGVMPEGLMVRDGVLYFSGTNRQHTNWELWRSDGTAEGTQPITRYEGPQWTAFNFGFAHGTAEGVFFVRSVRESTDPLVEEYQLWRTDGTIGSADLITSVGSTREDRKDIRILGSVNDTLLFNIFDEETGTFWAYRNGQTEQLAEVNVCALQCPTLQGGDRLFFTADDGIHGMELWETDGTPSGTRLVADVDPGPRGSHPSRLTSFNNSIVFSARTRAHGSEIWTYFDANAGDANRDGTFNSRDLVTVFQHGRYGQREAASWSEGDWNGDGFFDSSDLVTAFSDGNYSHAAQPSDRPKDLWPVDVSSDDEKRKQRDRNEIIDKVITMSTTWNEEM